jgi:predicted TPR repeat methyltransferase
MTTPIGQPHARAISDPLALWRAQYPRFGALLDDGAPQPRALRYLGLALWEDARLGEAANVLAQAAALAPTEPTILAELGSVLCAAGRKAEALGRLSASLRLAPHQTQVWLSVAGLCVELGNKETAEKAFRAALDLDPASAEAAAGLGLLYIERRRFDEAAKLLGAAAAQGVAAMAVHACLGQALFQIGDFSNASAALEKAARACPGEARIIQKYAEARLIEKLIEGPVVEAIEIYLSIASRYSEDLIVVCRKAFQVLCAYGKNEAAIRLGEVLMRRAPDDPIIGYHLDALQGRAPERAPDAYLKACFGAYAENFDRHIVEILDYQVPGMLPALLGHGGLAFDRILDLGCGTGLAAPYLSSLGGRLTGVDIAPRMLDKARERNAYGALIESEAIAYLTSGTAPFDLIVALDVLIYFGDLGALFEAVASRLAQGGLFACSFETAICDRPMLKPSGRFAHDPAHVEKIYGARFRAVASQSTTLRFEANQPVAGQLLLLRRM